MYLHPADHALPPGTLTLQPDNNVLELPASALAVATVALTFPKWTDGRAYSQAVLLRARKRYAGHLVAVGDVTVDMTPMLRRCGFDAAIYRAGQSLESAQRTLGHISQHYQQSLPERQAGAAT